MALVAVLSDGGLRGSEAASLTWGDVQCWDDGSGRITVVRSKTDIEGKDVVVAITPAAIKALDAIRPAGAGSEMDQTASVSVSTASVRNGLMCVKGVGKTYHWSCRSSANYLNKKLLIGSDCRT